MLHAAYRASGGILRGGGAHVPSRVVPDFAAA